MEGVLYIWWDFDDFVCVQPARWHKCQSYCVRSLCQAGIWSAENIVSENIISENIILENIISENITSENIISENIISENIISLPGWYLICREKIKPGGSDSTYMKNSDEIVIANLKTHKTAEPSRADTFCVGKSTAFLAVLNKNILVKSWQVWFSDQMKELTDPWRAL